MTGLTKAEIDFFALVAEHNAMTVDNDIAKSAGRQPIHSGEKFRAIARRAREIKIGKPIKKDKQIE